MFLIEKEGEDDRVISHTDLDLNMGDGWKVVKALNDCPSSVKAMPVSERSVKDVVGWYELKIKQHQRWVDDWTAQLKRFKQMVKRD